MKQVISFISLKFIALLLLSLTLSSFYANAQKSIFDTSSASLFSNDDEFLKVDEAFEFNFHQKDRILKIRFTIAEGYYLYRHQFKFNGQNTEFVDVVLPEGIDHEDEFFGVQQIYTGELNFDIVIKSTVSTSDISSITVRYQGCAEKGLCYPPTTQTVELSPIGKVTNKDAQAVLSALMTSPDSAAENESNQETHDSNETQLVDSLNSPPVSEQNKLAAMLQQDSLWLTLIAFFVGGLLLSFTPCVFPMYPILTGIIVGQGQGLTTKKAFTLSFFYVQGMAVTYTLLGIVVALAGAQFQAMFQHPVVLIAMSLLFIFLALSMFGVFNLALPSSWQNKLNNISNSQKGGSILGVVMMGVISGLVASPCTTAPLTGALLYISQSGDVVLGALALYALSLGMGLPLLVLGSSGGKILPKAGNWMNIIKNIFGFLLLAVPIFLLDRIIPAVVSQLLWAILLLATAGYFYVANHNSAQNTPQNHWYGVRAVTIFLMMFVAANIAYQAISPTQTSISNNSPSTSSNSFIYVATLSELQEKVKEANAQGKTVMVDLYADWCIACKEFEHYTFNTPHVQKALTNTLLVQIDLTDFDAKNSIELVNKYQILGLPSILFFNLQGQELTQNRVTGFMDADQFEAHVNAIFNSN